MDPSAKAVLECPFAAASRVNLGFDDHAAPSELHGNLPRLVRRFRHFPSRAGDVELIEQLLGLVFVNVHEESRLGWNLRNLEGSPLRSRRQICKAPNPIVFEAELGSSPRSPSHDSPPNPTTAIS